MDNMVYDDGPDKIFRGLLAETDRAYYGPQDVTIPADINVVASKFDNSRYIEVTYPGEIATTSVNVTGKSSSYFQRLQMEVPIARKTVDGFTRGHPFMCVFKACISFNTQLANKVDQVPVVSLSGYLGQQVGRLLTSYVIGEQGYFVNILVRYVGKTIGDLVFKADVTCINPTYSYNYYYSVHCSVEFTQWRYNIHLDILNRVGQQVGESSDSDSESGDLTSFTLLQLEEKTS